jgi:hypothetical protein
MLKTRLPGLHFNNLYFGPEGPAKAKAPAVRFKAAADAEIIPTRIYIAQYNFVDTDVSPKTELPGQPVVKSATPPVFVDINVNEGDPLGDYMDAIATAGLWNTVNGTGYDYTEGFLSWFYRGTGDVNKYDSQGSYNPPISGPGIYTWNGWGIMYYPGIFRPYRFEQYPQLGLGQMPVVTGNQVFTIDYAKVQILFEITSDGEAYLLHGQVL